MNSFRYLNWLRGGVMLVCVALSLLLVTGFSQKETGATHDRPETVGPLIARGYTDVRATSSLVAGDPEGGDIVAELKVRAGEQVREGQIIAVLGNHLAAEIEVSKVKVDIQSARAQERSMLSGFRATEIASQEITVKLAEADYRLKTLELSRTTLPPDERELRVTLLLKRMEREKARLSLKKQHLAYDLARARTDLLVLDSLLENAEYSREQTLVRAPLDGVVAEVVARTGERVIPRGIARIVDLAQMRIYADVDELHLNRLKPDGSVEFTLRGDSVVHAGRITRLPGTVKRTKRSESDFGESNVRLAEIEIAPVDQSTMAKMIGREARVVFR